MTATRAGKHANAVRFGHHQPMFAFTSLLHSTPTRLQFGRSMRVLQMAALLASVVSVAAVCVSKGGEVEFVQDITEVTDDFTLVLEATRADIELFRGDPGSVITQVEAGNRPKVTHRVRPGGTIPTSRLLIETFIPTEYAPRSRAIVRMWVPDGTRLEARGDDVSITIKGPLVNTISISGVIDLTEGDASLTDVVGDFEIDTGLGGITLNRVEGEYDAQPARGSIFFRGSPTVTSVSLLETGAGSIFADISRSPELRVSAAAGRGAILVHDGDEPISGTDISVAPPDGDASLELVTGNGIIDIRR
ncbi:MAG: hypothetical protein HOE75_13755 [Chloroflexi bacterium]|nr:hypothetical protein [Chloroflexota bacterium]